MANPSPSTVNFRKIPTDTWEKRKEKKKQQNIALRSKTTK
jgi:hypothetical protein